MWSQEREVRNVSLSCETWLNLLADHITADLDKALLYRNTSHRRAALSYISLAVMSDIELTHLKFDPHQKDVVHRSVLRQRRKFQDPFGSELRPWAGKIETDRDSRSSPHLKLGRRTLRLSNPCGDELTHEDARSPVSFTATNYNRGIHASEDSSNEDRLCHEGTLEDDHPDRYSDSRLLLQKDNRCRQKRRRRISGSYQKRTLQTYYHSAKALLRAQARGIKRSRLAPRTSQGPKTTFVKYDQIPQSPQTSYISEEHFWLLLKRFFGLLPVPKKWVGSFPDSNELAYIKNYLKSKPTPTITGDERDDGRDLVRICSMLTTFIFRDRESKRIFLGVDRRIRRRSQAVTWEVFQGFGLIHRFSDKLSPPQYNALHQDAWFQVSAPSSGDWYKLTHGIQASDISLPKRQYMSRIWASFRCLLLKKRQTKQHDAIDTMRCGLLQIYNALSTTDVNLPGRPGVEFSHFF